MPRSKKDLGTSAGSAPLGEEAINKVVPEIEKPSLVGKFIGNKLIVGSDCLLNEDGSFKVWSLTDEAGSSFKLTQVEVSEYVKDSKVGE